MAALSLLGACGGDAAPGGSGGAPPTTGTSGGSSGGGTGTGSTGAGSFGTGSGGSGGSTTGAPTLEVSCEAPPLGAVGATYDHTFTASGGSGAYGWSAAGLPAGIVLNPVTGKLTGAPEVSGSYDVTVTATSGANPPAVGMASCTIDIADALAIDLGALGKPCVEAGDDVAALVVGGNGAPLTCSTPGGTGNGKLPAGIAVDPASCAITGAITETRYGTWVWMTKIEQSGAVAWAPYCATQPVPGAYAIRVDHDGQSDAALIPGTGTFAPGQPISYGAGPLDPLFTITGGCTASGCYYGFVFKINASPFDGATFSLSPVTVAKDMGGAAIGMIHELSVGGPAVPAAFEGRPWVFNVGIDYCLAPDAATCSGAANIQANGQGDLEYGIIMTPQ